MTEPSPSPPPGVHAEASGQAQQAILGQGVQYNYFYAASAPGSGERPTIVDTLVPPPLIMVNRVDELRQLRSASRADRVGGRGVVISAVHGMGGSGKTALARTLAAEVAGEYADARIEVDLYGFTPGLLPRGSAEVLADLLGLVGFPPSEVPASLEGRSQLWRAWLSSRRVLLLLDNAREAGQVQPLLPGATASGRCLVLVTSRNRLTELEASTVVAVAMLPVDDAVQLLVHTGRRAGGETAGSAGELRVLAHSCGLLPLALRSVGSLLADLDPGDLIEVMRSADRPVEHIPQADRAAEAAFTVSYEALSAQQQDTLRACAWHPGPDFDATSIAALTGRALPVVRVQLVELLQANMLIGLPRRRYAFHDLFLGYARRRVGTQDAAQAVGEARHRLYADLQERLDAATAAVYTDNYRAVRPQPGRVVDRAQAAEWLVAAADELTVTAHAALADVWPGTTHLAATLAYWLHAGGRTDPAYALYRALHVAGREAGDQPGQAAALLGLGEVAHARGESQPAREAYQQAHELYQQIGDQQGEADALKGLGRGARLRGKYREAQDAYQQAYDLYQAIGNHRGQVDALEGLGDVADARGQTQPAHDAYQAAYQLARNISYRSGQADALCGLATVAQCRGDLPRAQAAYREAHDIYQDIGNRHGLAYVVKGLADVARLRGDYQQARDTYRRAHDLYLQIGFRDRQADVLRGLGDVALAGADYDQAHDHYQQALEISDEIGYRRGRAEALQGLGEVALARGEGVRAREYHEQARQIIGQIRAS